MDSVIDGPFPALWKGGNVQMMFISGCLAGLSRVGKLLSFARVHRAFVVRGQAGFG